jgi:predicted PurR-regulated permease PerM
MKKENGQSPGAASNGPQASNGDAARPTALKLLKNPQYYNIAVYAFLAIAASMLFYAVLRNVSVIQVWVADTLKIMQPVFIGLVLAYLLNPILRTFDDKLLPKITGKRMRRRVRRGIAILLTYLVAGVLVAAFIASVRLQLMDSVRSILDRMPSFLSTVASWYDSALDWLRNIGPPASSTEAAPFAFRLIDIDKLDDTMNNLLGTVYDQLQTLPSVLMATTTVLLNIVLGVIISIYLLFDREKFFAQAKKVMTAVFPKKVNTVTFEIAHEANEIFHGFIVGKIIDSIIIGILCYIGMLILRLDYPMLISFIVGVTNVIPYFGPFIGAIPSALILYVVEPRQALWFIIFIFLLQQFDGNILGPKILGDTIGISAFWVVFAITLFSGMYGIPGLFFGVPLFALMYSLIKRFTAFLLRRKGESVSTRDYDSDTNPLLK